MTNQKDSDMEHKKIIRKYRTHESSYMFVKTDYFCMNCGKKEVWEDDCDDYYQGTSFVCFSCGATWNNPSGVKDCDWFNQIKEQLK